MNILKGMSEAAHFRNFNSFCFVIFSIDQVIKYIKDILRTNRIYTIFVVAVKRQKKANRIDESNVYICGEKIYTFIILILKRYFYIFKKLFIFFKK